jgi:hypothetical protein
MKNNRKFSHLNIIDTVAIALFTGILALAVINAIQFGVYFYI